MADYNLGPFRIRPRGEFDPSEAYRFLDLVSYNGSSYVCINNDTIDGVSVTGVLPAGQDSSELYWQLIASKGDKGSGYQEYLTVTNGVWDFSKSDKIIIPDSAEDTLTITNIYSGCCGLILTTKELELPVNSDYSIDFWYVSCGTNQYYMYTFVYGGYGTHRDTFVWNRTVVNR